MDEKRFSKNCLVKVHDFRGATLADFNHHIIPILKKKPDVIILHVGTNDSVSRTSREILDDLLQLKSAFTKTLPNCQVIFSQPTLGVDNGKAALILHRLNQHFPELNYVTYEGKHLESNCSGVNKNSIYKNDNFCNTIQKLRVNNPLRIIAGQLNISSIRNKFDALCSIFKQKIDILLVFETKIDYTFPSAQFCVEGYSTPDRLDRTCKGGGLLLYVRDDISSKQIKLKFIENETFEGFFVEINLRKRKVASLLLL